MYLHLGYLTVNFKMKKTYLEIKSFVNLVIIAINKQSHILHLI